MKLSIAVFDPLWIGSGLQADDLAYDVPSYSHDITVDGGFDECSFSIGGDASVAEWWYNRLGCHVVVKSPVGTVIWEGFVNEVSLNLGALQLTRGPLLDVANRVTVSYSEVSRNYTSTNITVGGEQLYTTPYNDTRSQKMWGIQEIMLSASSVLPGEADQLGETYSVDNGVPRISQTVNLEPSSGADVSVTINCAGYVKMLEKYIFSDTTAGVATSTISEKIEDVISADPNGIFSTDYHRVAANSTVVSRYDDTYKTARAAIGEMIPLGDSSFNRYIWGIYADRKIEYKAVPTDIEYMFDLVDGLQKVTTPLGGEIDPWDVLPGKFIQINGLSLGALSNHPSADNLRETPGVVFIESVSYSAPFGLQLTGGKYDKITQRINRLGLGGF